jgi:hypothetical protein
MTRHSRGTLILFVASMLVGLYCQFAAIALLLTGWLFQAGTSITASLALVVGFLFFGLMIAAYFLAYGFWAGQRWSWMLGLAVFGTLIVGSLLLTLISGNPNSAVGPTLGGATALWYLLRPTTKARLLGTSAPEGMPHAGGAVVARPEAADAVTGPGAADTVTADGADAPFGSTSLETPQPVR